MRSCEARMGAGNYGVCTSCLGLVIKGTVVPILPNGRALTPIFVRRPSSRGVLCRAKRPDCQLVTQMKICVDERKPSGDRPQKK